MDTTKIAIAAGILIVVFVGLNIVLAFGEMYGLNVRGPGLITGTAGTECRDTVGGVMCDGQLYELKQQTANCPAGTIQTCTNSCQLSAALSEDTRICPTYCSNYCLSPDIANLLR